MASFQEMVGTYKIACRYAWVTLKSSRQPWPTREAGRAHHGTQAVAFSRLSTVTPDSLPSLLIPDDSLGDVCKTLPTQGIFFHLCICSPTPQILWGAYQVSSRVLGAGYWVCRDKLDRFKAGRASRRQGVGVVERERRAGGSHAFLAASLHDLCPPLDYPFPHGFYHTKLRWMALVRAFVERQVGF